MATAAIQSIASDLFAPPTVTPPVAQLGAWKTLLTVADNPLKCWDMPLFSLPYRVVPWQGRQFVAITDPDLIQGVFLDHADVFAKSPMQLRVTRPGTGDGLLTVEGATWRRQRRAASPAFRAEAITALAPQMAAAGERAAQALARCGSGPVDVTPAMTRATLEVIAHAALAADNPSLNLDSTARAVSDYVETIGRVDIPTIFGVPLWARLDKLKGRAAIQVMRDSAQAAITWRRANDAKGADLLYHLLAARDPETGEGLSHDELRDNVMTFIAAGHETTALTLTWTLYLLAHSPALQDRLHKELIDACGDGPVSAQSAERMVLHDAVLKESMRLFPPVAVLQRIATQDVRLGPLQLKRGDIANALIYVMQRAPRLWDDPGTFDPDRWLDARAEGRHRFQYIPFGAGPRICIGLKLAMLEGVVILGEIIRRLRFQPDPACVPMPRLRLTLRPDRPVTVFVASR